jgi:hypothetical protein
MVRAVRKYPIYPTFKSLTYTIKRAKTLCYPRAKGQVTQN